MMDDLDPEYTQMCSLQTIYSSKQGFFGEFYESAKDVAKRAWIDNNFNKNTPDKYKILCLFDDSAVSDIVKGTLEHVQPIFKDKYPIIAQQKFNEAEKYEHLGDTQKALMLYNHAVVRAVQGNLQHNDGMLPMILWNRSKVLLDLGHGDLAIQDLQLAFQSGLPGKQKGEYYWRLANCYSVSGNSAKARVSYKLAEQLLSNDAHTLKLLKEDIVSYLDDNQVNKPINEVNKEKPLLPYGESKDLSSASSTLELSQSTTSGRFIVSNTDIKSGDTLLYEKPIASCLRVKHFGTHCLECFKRLIAPIGCDVCSGVAFCSTECKNRALSTYHKWECKYVDLMIGSGMSMLSHLAFRIITQSSSIQSAIETGKTLLKNICSNAEKRNSDDFMQRSMMAVFLLRLLQQSGFFGRRKTEAVDPAEEELEIAVIIFGLLQALQFNAHEIYETIQKNNHKFSGSKLNYLGVGIYRTGSLFNHDCNPSVLRYFDGKNIVLCATSYIHKGNMVAENYGPIFTHMPLKLRQRNLRSRYWFKCECNSCKENWPLLDKMNNRARLRCPTFNCTNLFNYPTDTTKQMFCIKCKNKITLDKPFVQLKECEAIYKKAAACMEDQDVEKAIYLFTEGINLFYQVAVPPHHDTHVAQASLRVCLADNGNTYNVSE